MKQRDVVIGGTYLTRVGPDLVRVEVVQKYPVPGYSGRHDRFVVKNLRTGNLLRRTAAALRRFEHPLVTGVAQSERVFCSFCRQAPFPVPVVEHEEGCNLNPDRVSNKTV